MTIVKFHSLLRWNKANLINFGKSINKEVKISEFEGIRYTININPDLTAGQLTILEQIIDKIGKRV